MSRAAAEEDGALPSAGSSAGEAAQAMAVARREAELRKGRASPMEVRNSASRRGRDALCVRAALHEPMVVATGGRCCGVQAWTARSIEGREVAARLGPLRAIEVVVGAADPPKDPEAAAKRRDGAKMFRLKSVGADHV